MRITVEYAAQLRQAAGTSREELDLDPGCTPADLVRRIAAAHGDPLSPLLLDPTGNPRRSILLFVGDDQVRSNTPVELRDGDSVTLLSPVSGG